MVKFQFTYARAPDSKYLGIKKKPLEELIKSRNEACAVPEAFDLAAKMLAFDMNIRISAKEALEHPFFKL